MNKLHILLSHLRYIILFVLAWSWYFYYLGTFISNEAYDSTTSELYTAFHFAHMTILFIGLAFILQAILLISLVATRKVIVTDHLSHPFSTLLSIDFFFAVWICPVRTLWFITVISSIHQIDIYSLSILKFVNSELSCDLVPHRVTNSSLSMIA